MNKETMKKVGKVYKEIVFAIGKVLLADMVQGATAFVEIFWFFVVFAALNEGKKMAAIYSVLIMGVYRTYSHRLYEFTEEL